MPIILTSSVPLGKVVRRISPMSTQTTIHAFLLGYLRGFFYCSWALYRCPNSLLGHQKGSSENYTAIKKISNGALNKNLIEVITLLQSIQNQKKMWLAFLCQESLTGFSLYSRPV